MNNVKTLIKDDDKYDIDFNILIINYNYDEEKILNIRKNVLFSENCVFTIFSKSYIFPNFTIYDFLKSLKNHKNKIYVKYYYQVKSGKIYNKKITLSIEDFISFLVLFIKKFNIIEFLNDNGNLLNKKIQIKDFLNQIKKYKIMQEI